MRSYISFPSKLHHKIHRNNVDFSSIEIRSKQKHRNDVDITPNKLRRNDVDFSPIEITLKKCLEMKWKFIDIFFSTYRRNIDIIRRGVSSA